MSRDDRKDIINEIGARNHCLCRLDQKLSHYTSMGVGGECSHLIFPTSEESLGGVIKAFNTEGIAWSCIGAGTNIIVRDEGVSNVIVKLTKLRIDNFYNGNEITVHSGFKLSRFVSEAMGKGLAGLEFAVGIPGTLGGAVVMNAGSYGSEMFEVVQNLQMMDNEGNLRWYDKKSFDYGYRATNVRKKGIVMKVQMKLVQDDPEKIRKKVAEIQRKRSSSQPLRAKSAGCIFKNPENFSAGALIDSLGMKGRIFGAAKVSEIHANYIVNEGGASAKDVISLIEKIEDTVYEQKGIRLEREVEIW